MVAHLLGVADVRRHDQHRVAEVDGAALAVGQAPVVEHLQQHVEHLRVRLLDLVEQHDRVRAAAHGLRQLSALVVADVAGRRADEARHRVPLLVLAHVDADHRVLVVEHELGECAGELRLADAGRPEEDERPDRPVGILQAGARAAERIRDRGDRLVLADDALVQALLHVDQLLGLPLEQPVDRDAGPAGDGGGDVVLVDLLLDHRVGRPALALGELALERGQLAVADLGDALQVAFALGALGLHPQLVDPPRRVLDALERLLLLRPASGERVALLLRLGERTLERLPRLLVSFAIAASSISSCMTRRFASSSSSGLESISIRSREPASSTRSIALSGRKRSAM